jgi:hypothetical protein
VVTLACDFDVFASGIPASVAAIFMAGRDFTDTWNMCALGFALIIHLKVSPLQIVDRLDQ